MVGLCLSLHLSHHRHLQTQQGLTQPASLIVCIYCRMWLYTHQPRLCASEYRQGLLLAHQGLYHDRTPHTVAS